MNALPVRWRSGDDFAFATRLDVGQVFERSLVTNRFVAEVTFLGDIDRKNKSWKINKQTPQAVIINKTTTALSKMFAEAVEGGAERWNMEDISNENHFSIQRDDLSAGAKDWG